MSKRTIVKMPKYPIGICAYILFCTANGLPYKGVYGVLRPVGSSARISLHKNGLHNNGFGVSKRRKYPSALERGRRLRYIR